jgi:hypothetical protein
MLSTAKLSSSKRRHKKIEKLALDKFFLVSDVKLPPLTKDKLSVPHNSELIKTFELI